MKCCKNCSKELLPSSTRGTVGDKTYCDINCQHTYQTNQKIKAFLEGKYVGKEIGFATGGWPRKLLIENKGYCCNLCRISEWNNKTITLEVNHIDGDPYNNQIDNLEFLCPNCHSQTPTFRALNVGNGRARRRKS